MTLRFAAFTRVSTDEQEKRGESLATQAKQIAAAVAALKGTITARFGGGAEHGTTGFDRAQYDAMLAAAERQPRTFDAIMVQHEDRFSRDDTSAIADLERLKDAGVRFFVLGGEKDLHDATTRLHLGMSAVISAYHARTQAQKSIQNRIERARRNIPSGGGLPFGRTFDKKTETWGVDPEKQRMIADVARRFLGGATLVNLADEYGTTDSQLGRLLRTRCGPTWPQRFAGTVIETRVPELLDPDTIERVGRLLDARRKRVRRPPVRDHFYLLSGRIFCAHCGYAYTGQACTRDGRLGYRHYYASKRRPRSRPCPLGKPEPWLRAEVIERAVLKDLLSLLGNPAALERAVRSALPDTSAEEASRDDLESRLARTNRSIANIVRRIGEETITDEDARSEMARLHDQRERLQQALDRVNDLLADTPTPDELRRYVERFRRPDGTEQIRVVDENGHNFLGDRRYLGGNDYVSVDYYLACGSREDKVKLLEAAFAPGDRLADGKPAGVYVHASVGVTPRQVSYRLRGRLLPDAVRLLGCLSATGSTPRS
jgi:DNA invertase Pin-like site-specific DNA recombinase